MRMYEETKGIVWKDNMPALRNIAIRVSNDSLGKSISFQSGDTMIHVALDDKLDKELRDALYGKE